MAGKSASDLREQAIVKALSKRSKIDLCSHGINKKYCTFCESQKRKKSPKSESPKTEVTPA